MPNERKPRIALDPLALRALKIWSAIEDKDPGGLMSDLILDHIPARVRDVLRDLAPKPSDPPSVAAIVSIGPGVTQKKKRLADNPDALQKIRDLWASGEHNGAEIAREISYPRATVAENIARMKKAGELTSGQGYGAV